MDRLSRSMFIGILVVLAVSASAFAASTLNVTVEFAVDGNTDEIDTTLSEIAMVHEDDTSSLSLRLSGRNTPWFGFTGKLVIQGPEWLIPTVLADASDAASQDLGTVTLVPHLQLKPNHHYQTSLSYNAQSGLASVQLIDLADDLTAYESHFFLHSWAPSMPDQRLDLASNRPADQQGVQIIEQSVSTAPTRTGVPLPLQNVRLGFSNASMRGSHLAEVYFDDPLETTLSGIGLAVSTLPGDLRLSVVSRTEDGSSPSHLWTSPAKVQQGRESVIQLPPESVPFGAQQLVLSYHEDDYHVDISHLDLNVIAARIRATIEIMKSAEDKVDKPKAGRLTLHSNRDVPNLDLALLANHPDALDTPIVLWDGNVSLTQDEPTTVTIDPLPVDSTRPSEVRNMTFKIENKGETIIDVSTQVYRNRTFYVSPHGNDLWSGQQPTHVSNSQDGPFRTITRAASLAQAGDTVIIETGIYREIVMITHSGTETHPITFKAAPGAHVIVTGADLIPGSFWEKEDGDGAIYSAVIPQLAGSWNPLKRHPNDQYHELVGLTGQAIVHNYPLRQVIKREQMAHGTFYVDPIARRLYVWAADNHDVSRHDIVEISTRSTIWDVRGDHIHTKGINFRYAANQAQEGAVKIAGHYALIEDSVIEKTNGVGASFNGEHAIARRVTFQDHGQMGFGAAYAHHLLITDSVIRNNNTKGYNRHWEAGGNKVVLSRGVIFENNVIVENKGIGIWYDIGNEEAVIRNNLIAFNEDAGIFYEISYGLHAHDNVIIGNGLAGTIGTWGADAGISISSSPHSIIERNLIIGNNEGVNFREQHRETWLIDNPKDRPIWNHDQTIRNNIIAYNRHAQIGGWFDLDDNRHLPKHLHDAMRHIVDGEPQDDMAAEYLAKTREGHPVGITLEDLAIELDQNVYAVRPHQLLVQWGAMWRKHVQYESLEDVQKELDFDHESVVEQLTFADFHALDLRISPESSAWSLDNYPKGTVPGVKLGVLDQEDEK